MMRMLYMLGILFGWVNPGSGLMAQGYFGTIKSDTAYLIVNLPSLSDWEDISVKWGIPAHTLQQANPGVMLPATASPIDILIPVSGMLKNESCDDCRPVYHSVGKSEGLYRIGKCYGNQSVAVLKKKNGLQSDALQPGQQLLVGYIIPGTQPATATTAAVTEPAPSDTVSSPEKANITNEANEVTKPPVPRRVMTYMGEGAFAPEFNQDSGQLVRKSGKASTFKTESGWADGRFYILHSNLKQGLVVKVANPVTGVFLYAKVVGPLPDIKQNQGLSLRLSNAAASLLGFWEEDKTFELTYEY